MHMRKENEYLIVDFRGEDVPVMLNGEFQELEKYGRKSADSGYQEVNQVLGSGKKMRSVNYKYGINIPIKESIISSFRDYTSVADITNITFASSFYYSLLGKTKREKDIHTEVELWKENNE